ncbi:conserved hypothetical protein [Roseibium sp. TrichSKD4]|nr:conserved hypothetical protein [Roseibium sp. TrichSKD4]
MVLCANVAWSAPRRICPKSTGDVYSFNAHYTSRTRMNCKNASSVWAADAQTFATGQSAMSSFE